MVRSGDMIELSVKERRLHLDVPEAELALRRATWRPTDVLASRGYARLYAQHVLQADEGADFDFLRGGGGAAVPRGSH